ncbi:MAG: hypothetical protein Q4B95_03685 [Lonepinella koalarum]|nr:hypothetical protein [Lonepinella koalarum]
MLKKALYRLFLTQLIRFYRFLLAIFAPKAYIIRHQTRGGAAW